MPHSGEKGGVTWQGWEKKGKTTITEKKEVEKKAKTRDVYEKMEKKKPHTKKKTPVQRQCNEG